jgi:hypothetical protein
LGFRRALVEAGALRGTGRDYAAACAPIQDSFHPKVWLLVAPDEAALLVGSGNLTQSGFTQNAELFDAARLYADAPGRTLASDVIAFVEGLRSLWRGEREGLVVRDALDEIRGAVESLRDSMPAGEGGDVRFLTSFGGPLLGQLKRHFEGGALRVAAPYFGGSVSALRTLRESLALRELKVFPAPHAGGTLDLPLADLPSVPASAHPPRAGRPRRVRTPRAVRL